MTAALVGWYVLGKLREWAAWALDLVLRHELARWALAAAVVWIGWGAVEDRAHEAGVREERTRNDEMVRLEVERQRGVVQKALEDAQDASRRSQDDAARWERQARLAETRAVVLAGKACLPREVTDEIRKLK